MFEAILDSVLTQIQVTESLVTTHEEYAKKQSGNLERIVRQYSVASCITRLYSVYEWFVETLLKDYLDSLPELLSYEKIPNKLKVEYRMGISYLLGQAEKGRYRHLNHEDIIIWYHEALTGQTTYRFVTEALVRHDQNLRLAVLEDLTKRVCLSDLRGWLAFSFNIQEMFPEESNIVQELETELEEFVKTRNDVSHGLPENLLSANILKRYCALVRNLVKSFAAYCHWNLLQQQLSAGKIYCIGEVSEVLTIKGVCIVKLNAGIRISVGMSLYFMTNYHHVIAEISSIHDNNINIQEITIPNDEYELGLLCDKIPKKKSIIYLETN